MLKFFRVFSTGLFIAFIGMLPLGTLNLAAMQIAISDGLHPAFLFALGMLIPDVAYVLATLFALQWIQRRKALFRIFEWVTLAIVLALAVANFYAAMHPAVHRNVLLSNGLPKFLLGVVMNGANPMQIPFWFGWNTVLITKGILQPRWQQYAIYAAGVVAGTFAGTAIFIYGGRLVADRVSSNEKLIYFNVGGVFIVTAIVQIWKMRQEKSTVHKLAHAEEITDTFASPVDEINN